MAETWVEGAIEALRRLGYRMTPQRLLILESLKGAEVHLNADEIFAQVRARYSHVHISTIYRTLELLARLGMVTETDLGEGKKQYHPADKGQHHHLVCQQCGSTQEMDPSLLKPLEQALLQQYRFRPNLRHFAIFGLCPRCQGK